MAAELFYLPFPVGFTSNGLPAAGAKLYFYGTGTLTPADVYTDAALTIEHANPVVANGAGRFPTTYLDELVTYRLIIKSRTGVTLDDIDPLIPGTSGGQGPVGPPGASGTLAVSGMQFVTPQQHGAVGDGVTNDGAAFVAAIAALKAQDLNDDAYHGGSSRLYIPAGTYNMGTTTLEITHQLIIEGESTLVGNGTRLVWSGDCTGIRIQAYNTSGSATVIAPGKTAGAYTTIKGVALVGPYYNFTDFTGETEGEFHAIHAKSNYVIEDVYINGWAGDGLYSFASAGAGAPNEGNSNVSFVNRLVVNCVRNGVYLDGADANACTLIGVNGTYCRQHTVWDSSFLGNTHIGHHSANAGLVPGVPPSVVSHSGNHFGVRQGRTTQASTNSPPATGIDDVNWIFMSAAGGAIPGLNIPLWTNAMTLREGGGYKTDNVNARNLFVGCYQEGGEAPFQVISPTAVIGGFMPVTSNAAGNVYQGDVLIAPNGVKLGQSRVAADIGPTESVLTVQNSHVLTNAYKSRLRIAQGFEADGVTPYPVVDLIGLPVTGGNNSELILACRNGGVMTEFLEFAPFTNATVFYPVADNTYDLALGALRLKTIFGYTGDFTTQVKIAGTKVLGAQGAAVADAAALTSVDGTVAVAAPTKAEFDALVAEFNKLRTDVGAVRTTLNTDLARERAHGLIAT